MGIADDLASVFDEIGTEVEVVGSSPLITEYIDFEKTDKVGVFACTFRAATEISSGDILKVTATDEHYLVYGGFYEQFENESVVFDGKMFQCTHKIQLQRFLEVKDPVTREVIRSWPLIAEAWAYVTVPNTGNGLNVDEDDVFFVNSVVRVFCSASFPVKYLDRIRFSSGSFYQVGTIDVVRYPGVMALGLVEDVR